MNADVYAQNVRQCLKGADSLAPEESLKLRNLLVRMASGLSPLRNHPVDCVLWVPAESLKPNDYNPNSVAPPEMKLLKKSIEADGYTQPVVSLGNTVIDGFHRYRVGRETPSVRKATRGHLPAVQLLQEPTRSAQMASTIRHNRARGKHGVKPMSSIVAAMKQEGVSNERIAEELGMCRDEVLRLQQMTGLAALFENEEFSEAWE